MMGWGGGGRNPRKYLLNVYKSFVRPHLDYGDALCSRIESDQYTAALEITGAIKGIKIETLS